MIYSYNIIIVILNSRISSFILTLSLKCVALKFGYGHSNFPNTVSLFQYCFIHWTSPSHSCHRGMQISRLYPTGYPSWYHRGSIQIKPMAVRALSRLHRHSIVSGYRVMRDADMIYHHHLLNLTIGNKSGSNSQHFSGMVVNITEIKS